MGKGGSSEVPLPEEVGMDTGKVRVPMAASSLTLFSRWIKLEILVPESQWEPRISPHPYAFISQEVFLPLNEQMSQKRDTGKLGKVFDMSITLITLVV